MSQFLYFLLLFSSTISLLPAQTPLWQEGEGDHGGYRIPALITTPKGTVLAFCEGRNDGGDAGDINLLLRRSYDNGKTWEPETNHLGQRPEHLRKSLPGRGRIHRANLAVHDVEPGNR